MSSSLRSFSLIILLFLLPPSFVTAASPSTSINVGIFPLEPLTFLDDKGRAQGLYPALISKIAHNEQWRLHFIYGSWAEGLTRLQTGEIDLITTVAYTPERAKIMDFSHESIVDIWGQLFTLPEKNIQDISELENAKVAVMQQDINGQNFINLTKQFDIHCEIIQYPSHKAIFRAIKNREVTAGVAPQHYGLTHMKEFNLVASSIRFSPFSIYFATKKGKHKKILERIDFHIGRWKAEHNSFYHDQLAYWMGGREYERTIIPKWLVISIVLCGGIVTLLLLLNRTLNLRVRRRTKELSLREKQYRDLVESANSIILRWDRDGKIIFLNKYGMDLFGYSRDEIIGHHVLDTIVPNEDSKGENLQMLIAGILNSPENYKINENENISKTGQRFFIQWTNKAIVDPHNNFIEMLSVGINITKRKELETELFQAQKMEAIGTLAGGIAHDFNNILSVIFGYTELAKLEINDPEKLTNDLEQVLNAAQRAKQLVDQILTFSRKTGTERHPLQLSILVKETIKMLRSTLPSTINIKQNVLSDHRVMADPTQIHQLLMNLSTNAFHAMEEKGGTLGISLKDIHVNKDKVYSSDLDLADGNYVQIEISDTGTGIPPETICNIFEPYFTTKSQGKGTGLGLAVVHGIIKGHNGHIKVYSVPEEGTTFHVYFPVTDNNNSHLVTPLLTEEHLRGGIEHILIVDDERQIAETVSKILATYGYNTETYTDPREAMMAFETDPGRFDLVITDMTMPDITGLKLAEKMLALKPDIPIILCTGYSELINKEKSLRLGITAYLQKPVELQTIVKTVREKLDGQSDN